MGFLELALLSIGLSMDAFAVAICRIDPPAARHDEIKIFTIFCHKR